MYWLIKFKDRVVVNKADSSDEAIDNLSKEISSDIKCGEYSIDAITDICFDTTIYTQGKWDYRKNIKTKKSPYKRLRTLPGSKAKET